MTKRKKPVGDEAMVKEALSRLVHALVSPEGSESTRLDMVEDALMLAHIALGETTVDQEKLHDSMEVLAVQVLIDKLQRDDATICRLSVVCEHGNEAASIVATTSPAVSVRLAAAIENKPLLAVLPAPTMES